MDVGVYKNTYVMMKIHVSELFVSSLLNTIKKYTIELRRIKHNKQSKKEQQKQQLTKNNNTPFCPMPLCK